MAIIEKKPPPLRRGGGQLLLNIGSPILLYEKVI